MKNYSRRDFIKNSMLGATAISATPLLSSFPVSLHSTKRELVFRPFPHPQMPPLTWAYAADESEDPFKSPLSVTREGIIVPEEMPDKKFSINARWFVEGFGYTWLSANNRGKFYSLGDHPGNEALNLNYEFASSRVARNNDVLKNYRRTGTEFSPEVRHLVDLSEEFLEDASKQSANDERCAARADRALYYSLIAGETIERENAKSEIARFKKRQAYFGCESRQFVWAKSEEFAKRFTDLMRFATVTHYVWDSWYELFEPTERRYNWGIKDDIVAWLRENDITIQGRPLFWFHPSVTPDWLKQKNFDQLKVYVDHHARDLVSHYGDKVLQWEVMNEYHDRANIHNHTPEQTVEITRLACDTVKDANPNVIRILNHCAPWAEYVAEGKMAGMPGTRPLRSPRRFVQELIEAGVDFDVLGIQIYFPQRDLSDIARMLERLAVFGKPIYITEIGASSDLFAANPSGSIVGKPSEPYAWHRHWDEELQADWLEQVYTLYYSKSYVKAINW
ncbi:MAG TPA: endo-1,4-beta-xylanase, partial [Bacteroidota bacterium]